MASVDVAVSTGLAPFHLSIGQLFLPRSIRDITSLATFRDLFYLPEEMTKAGFTYTMQFAACNLS